MTLQASSDNNTQGRRKYVPIGTSPASLLETPCLVVICFRLELQFIG